APARPPAAPVLAAAADRVERPAVPAPVQAAPPAPVRPSVPVSPIAVPPPAAPIMPQAVKPAPAAAASAQTPPAELNDLLGPKAMAEIEASIASHPQPQPLFNPEQPFTVDVPPTRAAKSTGTHSWMRFAAAIVTVLLLSGAGLYAIYGRNIG